MTKNIKTNDKQKHYNIIDYLYKYLMHVKQNDITKRNTK